MKLSVIIPALNEATDIATAVERAFGLEPLEVLVADGGSTDGTQAIVQATKAKLLEVPRGRARQQNAAAASASGDLLLFLHADCWLEPQAKTQIEQWSLSKSIAGGTFQQKIDATGPIYRLLEYGNSLRVCITRVAFGDQGILVRSEVFNQLGGFPDVALMEDVLFMRKLKEWGRLQLLPGPLHVDARRWVKHGPIRQTLRNWFLLTAEQFGVHPNKLSQLYLSHWISKRANS